MIVAVCAHQPLLGTAARCLIVQEGYEDCNYVAPLGGDKRYQVAAGIFASGPKRRVLVLEDSSRNLVIFGIVQPEHEVASRELAEHGVPHEAISIIDRDEDTLTQTFDDLDDWMEQRDEAIVCVLTGRFGSRRARCRLDRMLDAGNSARVRVVGLPDRRYDETDWWKSRVGIKEFTNSWLALLHDSCVGATANPHRRRWEPIAYEQQLRQIVEE